MLCCASVQENLPVLLATLMFRLQEQAFNKILKKLMLLVDVSFSEFCDCSLEYRITVTTALYLASCIKPPTNTLESVAVGSRQSAGSERSKWVLSPLHTASHKALDGEEWCEVVSKAPNCVFNVQYILLLLVCMS